MRSVPPLIVMAVVLALPVSAYSREKPPAPDACIELKPGVKAPPFSIIMSDGTPGVSLAAGIRKKVPIVVNFWAYNCTGCVEELPMLQKVATDLAGKASVMLVHAGKDEVKMKAKLAELGVKLPSASDDYKETTRSYCVSELPRTFVLSPSGVVQSSFALVDEAKLRAAIAAANK